VEFRILGSLEVADAAGPVAIRGTKRRGLLAYLLLQRERMISAARIADELWPENPETGVSTVQTYVSQLRKLFATDSSTSLVTHPAGYVLHIARDALDSVGFERELRQAKSAPDLPMQLRHLDRALELWRGTPLEEFEWPWAIAARVGFERSYLEALCQRIEVRLALGQHREILGELESLTNEHPLDERFWRQRILAEYRSGRQVDALRAFQSARERLADVGIEPGAELAELERRLLDQDPSLSPEPSSVPTPSSPGDALPSGVVSFLLTDIVGSTQLWEQFPEEMLPALERHDEIVGDVVAARQGRVVKKRGEGDSTFSVFARATDAVHAAIELQRALLEENWALPSPFEVRAAVSTGEAVEREGDYYGTQVNRAARLRGLAGAGEVLLANATAEIVRHHLGDGAVLVDLGTRDFAGSTRPEHIHRVEFGGRVSAPRASAAPDYSTALPPFLSRGDEQFVGREFELDVLRRAWEETRHGEKRVVFVAGEPGIGKTSLVSRFARLARREGAVVIAGRCDEGYDVPYQPFIEALAPLLERATEAGALGVDPRVAVEIGRILPSVADRLPTLPVPVITDPETDRYRLFEAVAAWLASVAEQVPLVLVIDDLHWASAPTSLLLRHLARYPAPGLLILATYRPTEVPLPTRLAQLLADLQRETDFQVLEVGGLGAPDIDALLARARGDGEDERDIAEAEAILEQTGGNALFVRELLRGDGSQRGAALGDGAEVSISGSLRGLILDRVTHVSAACRQLLEVASLIGAEFDLGTLLAVGDADLPIDDRLDAVDDAVAGRLLNSVGGVGDRYRFAHAIVRDAITENLPINRRRRLHLAVAHALETRATKSGLAQVAHHYIEALPLGGATVAVQCAQEAGDYAMSVLAFEDAVDLYSAAVTVLGETPTPERCELLLALAEAHAGAGETIEGAAVSAQAAVLARELQLPRQFARAALCFEGEMIPGGDFWDQRHELLDEAYHMLADDEDLALRARTVAMLAHVRIAILPASPIAALADEAVELAIGSRDNVAIAAALQSQRYNFPQNARERAELSARVVAHAEEADATQWIMLGRHAHLLDLLELGNMKVFDEELAVFTTAAHRIRRPHDLWRAEVMRAMRALFDGELDTGELLARDAFEVGTRLQLTGAMQAFVVQTFFLAWQRGTLEPLVEQAREWADGRSNVLAWRASLAVAYALVGREEEARDALRVLAADDFAHVERNHLWIPTLALAAEAAWTIGDRSCARALRSALAPYIDLNTTLSTALALGPVARPYGLAQLLDGDFNGAVASLQRAVMLSRDMGSPLWIAACRRALVDALRARNGKGDAALAASIDAELGATYEMRENASP
jgi:DNA-binding SARP family transcriptional activator